MIADVTLDVEFCRAHFPAMSSGWVFMENAGGTLVPSQVIERASNFMTHNQVQPGEGYEASEAALQRISEGRAALAALINAEVDEVVVGPSTTNNVYVLSHALGELLSPGDEVIVTNQDHEANNGSWRKLESIGCVIREWQMNGDTDDLEIEDLDALLNHKTKLVCFTHCSNIIGMVHDVKAIVAKIHQAGALACVDGVAYAPHRRVDVKDLDVDFYLYSPYKVFGPHLGVLYAKRELLAETTNQSHYFLVDGDFQRRLCPGGPNYELTAASGGMAEYFDAVHTHHFPGANIAECERLAQVFALFAEHETTLAQSIENFLNAKAGVRLMGRGAAGLRDRVGVFSFLVNGRNSREIPAALREHRIGIYADDFYASRCIDALGARANDGVIRVSLAHYNSVAEVDRLIYYLDEVIPS